MLSDTDFESLIGYTDDLRRENAIRACAEHLSDLVRAYGAPANVSHKPSYPQILPWPVPTLVPSPDRG